MLTPRHLQWSQTSSLATLLLCNYGVWLTFSWLEKHVFFSVVIALSVCVSTPPECDTCKSPTEAGWLVTISGKEDMLTRTVVLQWWVTLFSLWILTPIANKVHEVYLVYSRRLRQAFILSCCMSWKYLVGHLSSSNRWRACSHHDADRCSAGQGLPARHQWYSL